MSMAKRLVLIAAGYALCVVAGFAAVTVNELRMPADVAQGSPGMVAFGDMILFVLVAGFVGLAPTWFLLKLFIEKAPRVLLAIVLLVAAMGPASWLAVRHMAGGSSPPNLPQAVEALLGLFIAFVAIPRMVLGPGPPGDRGSGLLPGPRARHARAARRGDADGPRPARHVRAPYDARDPLLGAGRRFDRLGQRDRIIRTLP